LHELAVGWGWGDRSLSQLAGSLQLLVRLEVGVGASLTDAGLQLLAGACQHLQHLSLTLCAVSDAGEPRPHSMLHCLPPLSGPFGCTGGGGVASMCACPPAADPLATCACRPAGVNSLLLRCHKMRVLRLLQCTGPWGERLVQGLEQVRVASAPASAHTPAAGGMAPPWACARAD
jgi:hypothetical protein